MSLEQALIDATAAITRLTTVLVSASEAGVVTAAPAEKAPRKSKSEAQVVAPVTTPEAVAPVTSASPPTTTTRYFHIASHNTVYEQGPGMPDCKLPGALIVSKEEYLAAKEEYAKKFPTASAVATPAPATSEPIATAPAVIASATFEQVVEKLRALHKLQGDAGVAKVLAKFGVSRVPELNGKFENSTVLAAVEAITAAGV